MPTFHVLIVFHGLSKHFWFMSNYRLYYQMAGYKGFSSLSLGIFSFISAHLKLVIKIESASFMQEFDFLLELQII